MSASPLGGGGSDKPGGAADPGGLPATVFFDKTYDEAYRLLLEARDYAAHGGARDSKALEGGEALIFVVESFRLSTRLIEMIVWLMKQRAIHDGELAPEAIRSESSRLGSREICLQGRCRDWELLPGRLRQLLDRSENLFIRIARLDDMLCRGQGGLDSSPGKG